MTRFMAYRLSYQTNQEGRGGYILYHADSTSEAVAAGQRWMIDREKYPDLFGRIVYFELSPYVIGPIDENGAMTNPGGFRIMEWSRDRAGVDRATYCEWKIEEFKRADEKLAKIQAHHAQQG